MRKTMKNVGVRNDFPAHEHVSKGPKQQQQQQQQQHERILVSYNPIQRTAEEKEEEEREGKEVEALKIRTAGGFRNTHKNT
ncbi:hypothetical protein HZH68_014168 [Vespula germanica]|uniref:Uncharacterized protein n=1 Tax=Vespula germanica TaxID=30212 RepID=A0A834JFB3_VESGE|nr:hypothetical protein HZH68_014168 [Vespula germanica]